jgi:hypothetical protein
MEAENFSQTAVNYTASWPENNEPLEGKDLLGKTRCRSAFTNKVCIKGAGCKIMNWSDVSRERIS